VLIGSLPTTASEHALRATELMLDILRRGGFSPDEAAYVTRQIVRTTTSMVLADFARSPADEDAEATSAGTEAFLRSLSPARFPRIIEAAGPLSATEDPDAYYELVIELLLTGIEAIAVHRRGARRTDPDG
jgi:TetR/AcrR family transcriptional regulator, tetracycline repressor protein